MGLARLTLLHIHGDGAQQAIRLGLAMYRAQDIEDAFAKAERLVADGGYGHTASIYLPSTS